MKTTLKRRIEVARGLKKADLVLKNGNLVNVFSGEIYKADIAVHQGTIAGIGRYEGKRNIDVASGFLLPGFIDGHAHIESSLVAPAEYARAAVARGTTAVVADPHEIANVLGVAGIRSMLDATGDLPVTFYFMLPSCVPASPRETSGARLGASRLRPFLRHPRVLGLGEVMDCQAVLSADRDMLKKLETFARTRIDGHAPLLEGKDLSAYIGTGISSDHECVTASEALEKIRLGMTVFIRESSAAKNLASVLPAVTPENSRFFCLATDDLQPADLRNGGISRMIRKAIKLGVDPVTAVRMATINPARHFNLHGRGAIGPGYAADIVIIDNFRNFTIEKVYKDGELVAEKGRSRSAATRKSSLPAMNTVKTAPLTREDIRLRARTGHARVIELIPDRIETRQRIMPVIVDDGMAANDRDRDIAKLIVVERHKASGRVGIGLVKGFGLRSGAFASTVAHDSHNIIAVGMYDEDILAAVEEIKKMKGGFVVVKKGKVLASLPLPIAGLMSEKPVLSVVRHQESVLRAVKQLGVKVKSPFAALSFLALPVIPELKLTDRGLVQVKESRFVDLFV
jgi:adenine deaminase